MIAEGIASDLYKLVAETSQANASLAFGERLRISATEVERRIFERLEADDPSAVDQAILSGALEPVDFATPVVEPSFYQGVKVRPGHVAAGLVLSRPDELKAVVRLLKKRRHLLISGPSGAGKSGLMWLAASALSGELRWFQISAKASVADAVAIVRFVRARRPTASSPIGLAFDEVGASNSDLWNVLVGELRGLPAVHFSGFRERGRRRPYRQSIGHRICPGQPGRSVGAKRLGEAIGEERDALAALEGAIRAVPWADA
jgi:hypothetical protein